MKIKPTDKVKVVIKGEAYKRHESGGFYDRTIIGSWEEVLNHISQDCSYGWTVGEDEWGDALSCEDVLESILSANGDGCDFIFFMEVEAKGKKKVLIEEDFEEIYIA